MEQKNGGTNHCERSFIPEHPVLVVFPPFLHLSLSM